MRNILAHEYGGVTSRIWSTAKNDIPNPLLNNAALKSLEQNIR